MQKVRLKIKSVSAVAGSDDIGLIVLVDSEEIRQITLPCDRNMLYQFGIRMNGTDTEGMLPETFHKFLSYSDMEELYEILFTGVKDGRYEVRLSHPYRPENIPMRASDAVLLSLVANIPIYISMSLMMSQSSPYVKNSRGVSLPINILSSDLLSSALHSAVRDENYELASHIRDELNRRKKKDDE